MDIELMGKAASTQQFIWDFRDVITESTPHLYISALPLAPYNSFIAKTYLSSYPRLLSVEVGQVPSSSSILTTSLIRKKNTCRPTQSLFSPQGNYIATSFRNNQFWIWDHRTGEIIHQNSCNPDVEICDIVFSPGEDLLYCCLLNGDIWIWDSKTNDTVHESYQEIFDDKHGFCTVSSDSHYIAFHLESEEIVVFDRKNRLEVTRFKDTNCSFQRRSKFCPSGDLFAFISVNTKFDIVGNLWSTRTRTSVTIVTWSNHGRKLYRTIASFSDTHIAFTARSSFYNQVDIEIWDVQKMTKSSFHLPKASELDRNFQLTLLPDGEHFLSKIASSTAPFPVCDYTVWNIETLEKILDVSVNGYIYCVELSPDLQFVTFEKDGIMYAGRHVDISFCTEADFTSSDSQAQVLNVWLRKSRLIYFSSMHSDQESRSTRYHLQVSDITIMNKRLLEVEADKQFLVAVPDDHQHVCVAYVTNHGRTISLWNETNGEIALIQSNCGIIALAFSTTSSGDFLVFCESDQTISILKLNIRHLNSSSGYSSICKYTLSTVEGLQLAISTTGTHFLVAYECDEQLIVEVRECLSGSLTAKYPVDGDSSNETRIWKPTKVAFSANDTFIICISQEDITIWNAMTKTRRNFDNLCTPQLSSEKKFVAFIFKNDKTVGFRLWDIENEVAFDWERPLDYDHDWHYNFSLGCFDNFDDSTRIMLAVTGCESTGRGVSRPFTDLFILDSHTEKWTANPLRRFSTHPYYGAAMYKGYIFLKLEDTPFGFIENLRVYNIIHSLYEHHRGNSQFGDDPEKSTVLTDDSDIETLNYALKAWHKASTLFGTSKMDKEGWMLGPHDELLFWVPKERRDVFWYPWTAYTNFNNFTKLNFEKFVHGSRWTECRLNF